LQELGLLSSSAIPHLSPSRPQHMLAIWFLGQCMKHTEQPWGRRSQEQVILGYCCSLWTWLFMSTFRGQTGHSCQLSHRQGCWNNKLHQVPVFPCEDASLYFSVGLLSPSASLALPSTPHRQLITRWDPDPQESFLWDPETCLLFAQHNLSSMSLSSWNPRCHAVDPLLKQIFLRISWTLWLHTPAKYTYSCIYNNLPAILGGRVYILQIYVYIHFGCTFEISELLIKF
jgi:hypothetical protein